MLVAASLAGACRGVSTACQFDSGRGGGQADDYDDPMGGWVQRWLARHRHPVSLALHGVAVPMLPLAGVLAGLQLVNDAWHLWWRPVLLVIVSYALQWIGHHVEGNEMGEIVALKKLLGLPYVAVSPRYTDAPAPPPSNRSTT